MDQEGGSPILVWISEISKNILGSQKNLVSGILNNHLDFWDLIDLKKYTEISKKSDMILLTLFSLTLLILWTRLILLKLLTLLTLLTLVTLSTLSTLLTLLTLATLSNDIVVAIWNKNLDGFWGYASISKTRPNESPIWVQEMLAHLKTACQVSFMGL